LPGFSSFVFTTGLGGSVGSSVTEVVPTEVNVAGASVTGGPVVGATVVVLEFKSSISSFSFTLIAAARKLRHGQLHFPRLHHFLTQSPC
jgi:hypothetical protein